MNIKKFEGNTKDSNKIVMLPTRQIPAQSAGERLDEPLKTLRELVRTRVTELVNVFFENIDDALFDLAEHAQSNALQTEYFDGMREVRRKRQRVERLALDKVSSLIADFTLGKTHRARAENVAHNAGMDLSLVDEQELEESLAISAMVAKAETRLSRHIYALNRRLSALRGGTLIENGNNPIGPALICDVFRLAMEEFELNLPVRLIVYKLFDRYVLAGLGTLYDQVNAHLIQSGVLPQLRHHVAQSGSAQGASYNAGATRGNSQREDNNRSMDGSSVIEAQIYQTLRSLLALRHAESSANLQHQITSDFPSAPTLPQLGPTDLLSALQILQNQTLQAQSREQSPSAQQLKRAVFEQADKLHAGSNAQVASVDEDTIDLVGMLFEFIVQDRDLPPQMQALLGRLQIPFLKVAILDRHLFTQKTHPARQLLDNMASACIGKNDGAHADQALYEKVKTTVETILRDFDDDMTLLERENADFSAFMETQQHRADLVEKRTAQRAQGREKLDFVRRRAASEMKERCDATTLPPLFDSLINGPLTQYLVLIGLRQGETSVEWRQALSFADALIWSTSPKLAPEDKTRLKNLLPALINYLHQSLAKVAWQQEDIQAVVQELNAFYAMSTSASSNSMVGSKTDPTLAQEAQAGAENLMKSAKVAALVDMMEKTAPVSEPPSVSPADPTDVEEIYLEQIRAMQVGTWVEFSNPDTGTKERAKLSWISPISCRYLFVDRKGLKVEDRTVPALAELLGVGRLSLLEDSMPLFDRAMGAIVERLQSFQLGN